MYSHGRCRIANAATNSPDVCVSSQVRESSRATGHPPKGKEGRPLSMRRRERGRRRVQSKLAGLVVVGAQGSSDGIASSLQTLQPLYWSGEDGSTVVGDRRESVPNGWYGICQ